MDLGFMNLYCYKNTPKILKITSLKNVDCYLMLNEDFNEAWIGGEQKNSYEVVNLFSSSTISCLLFHKTLFLINSSQTQQLRHVRPVKTTP